VQILDPFVGSIQQYSEEVSNPDRYRPDHCPQCRDVRQCRYVLHDRDTKVCRAFDEVLASEGIRF
jgi:hypothetical protein